MPTKRAFVIYHGSLASALVPRATREALHLGDRIRATRALDIDPGTQISRGERGTISYLDAITGGAEVLMDTHHRGLDAWDNHLLIEPFGTEDILGGLEVTKGGLLDVLKLTPRWARVVGASVAASVVAVILHNTFVSDVPLAFDAASNVFSRVMIISLGVAAAVSSS